MSFLKSENTKYPPTGDGSVGHEVRLFAGSDPALLESDVNGALLSLQTLPLLYRLLDVKYTARPGSYSALILLERVAK